MSEKIKRSCVADVVAGKSAAIVRLKGVFMNPLKVGAANLLIHKTIRRLPEIDPGAPTQRQAVYAQAVVNERPLAHLNRRLGNNPKIQPRRREGVEVCSVGEERKQFIRR